MKVLKKTAEYTVYQKRSGRYAVVDADKNTVNGDEKVAILIAEGFVTQAAPKVEEAPAEEAPAEEAPAEEAPAEEAPAEEAPAEEAPAEEAPAEEAPAAEAPAAEAPAAEDEEPKTE